MHSTACYPTGTLAARLHGVETIREFVSSAAVTLALDFPFLPVILAVVFTMTEGNPRGTANSCPGCTGISTWRSSPATSR